MTEYERSDGRVSGTGIVLAFLSGAAIGAIAALLLAPQSGQESRDSIRTYARRTGDDLREMADKAGETWQTAVDKGREFVQEQKSTLKDALEAGREAMRRQREQPEQRTT
ncbi:MAG TPA: YtxH domain-containing protein [Nitrospiraceae bacterium]|jgi:gas vesicle protein|nr:YtxH domain-containing protein [Nitrospiraceae bacterium]